MAHWTDFLAADSPDGAYLPWKKVEPRVGISRTTAWRLQKAGEFPKPYVVSPGRVAYREREVEAWKASRGHRSATTAMRPPRPTEIREALPPPTPESPSWTPPPDREPFTLDPPATRTSPPVRQAESAKRTPRNRPNGDQMTFKF